MSGEATPLDPPVDRVLRDAEVFSQVVDRRPGLCHPQFRILLCQLMSLGSLQERAQVGKSRFKSA